MGSIGKVTDVANAFGVGDTVSIGDIFWKKSRKSSRKSSDPPADARKKRPRASSTEVAAPVH